MLANVMFDEDNYHFFIDGTFNGEFSLFVVTTTYNYVSLQINMED